MNSAIGYNGDTGKVRYVDLTNNIALNTAIGWRIDQRAPSQMYGFNLSGNTMRLGPIVTFPVYRSYCWNEQYETYTDPSLILGRIRTNSLITGAFLGSINQVQYDQNWFTTPPAPRFDLSNPGGTNGVWIPFHKSPSLAAGCDQWKAVYSDGSTYALTSNRVSTLAWDFVGGTAITGGSYGTFGTNTFPALQTNRLSLASLQSGFSPTGHVERVQPIPSSNKTNFYSWKTSATNSTTVSFVYKKLGGAYELVIGTPTVSSNQLVIPVRLAVQRSLLGGFVDTLYASGRKVWLEIAGHSTNSATTGTGGFATFTLPLSGITHEMLELTAYHHLVGTANPPFNPYEVAIAKARHPIGNVVWMEASPDVAVDRRPGSLQFGSLRLRRSGNSASSLTVGILPEANGVRYATLNSHYSLVAVAPATRSIPSGTNWVHTPTTVTFAANQAEAELRVNPFADEVIERHVVWWKLSAPVSTNYALGHRTTASVAIYDGPEWTLHEITDDGTPYPTTEVFALNNELNGSGQPNPRIAGLATIQHTNGYGQPVYGTAGAWWQGTLDAVQAFFGSAPPASLAPRALSVANPVSGITRYVGHRGNVTNGLPRAIRLDGSGWNAYLPMPTGWYPYDSTAETISPSGSWIGGYAACFTNVSHLQRPVAWTWNGTNMIDLTGGLNPDDDLNAGSVLGVNDSGEFVGWRLDGYPVHTRAFRSRTNANTLATGDVLLAPEQDYPDSTNDIPDSLLSSVAHDISTSTIEGGAYVSGVAAGESDLYADPGPFLPVPTTWTRRLNSDPNDRGVHREIPSSFSTGSILGLNSTNQAVGWIGNATGGNRRAVYWPVWWGNPWNLSDPHTVYGVDSSWVLSEAVDINESGVILGNGTKSGSPRGFILIQQPSN